MTPIQKIVDLYLEGLHQGLKERKIKTNQALWFYEIKKDGEVSIGLVGASRPLLTILEEIGQQMHFFVHISSIGEAVQLHTCLPMRECNRHQIEKIVSTLAKLAYE